MRCSLTRLKIKRRTKKYPRSSGVYKGSKWEPKYPGSSEYTFKGEEVKRDLKEKWRIVLYDSFKENGKIKRKQWYVCTITYWDIVDDYFVKSYNGKLLSHAWKRLNELFPDAGEDEKNHLKKIVLSRIEPLRKKVILDYQKSDEYYYRLIQNMVEQKHKESQAKKNKKTENNHKSSYNENEKKSERKNNKKSENKKKHIRIKKNVYQGNEKEVALEIIRAGYKKMAAKYHPDTGGSTSMMQKLNIVRDRLINLCTKF